MEENTEETEIHTTDGEEEEDGEGGSGEEHQNTFLERETPVEDIDEDMEVLKEKKDNRRSPEEGDKKEDASGDVDVEGGERGEAEGGENVGNKPVKSTKHLDIRRERGIKLCVRRLPPEMTKKEFLKAFDPLPPHNYLSVNNPDKEWMDGRSVAWINFMSDEDAAWFMGRFNGYNIMDNRGSVFTCAVDLSPELAVPKYVRYNKKRGSLVNSDHYKRFLQKLEDKTAGKVEDTVSLEKMLEEIESRTERKKEPENTPLVDFILHRKKDPSVSPEKPESKRRDRDRDRDRRDKENRDKPNDKASRRERRRDRDKKREKDRKERRVREKIEKEAQAKGMTVTYSRSGKVTRWSANSSPLMKKEGPSTSTAASAGAAAKSSEPAAEKVEKTEKIEKNEKFENNEKQDKNEKYEKNEKNEKTGKGNETSNKQVRIERRPFAGDKPERKPVAGDKPERKAFPGDKKPFPGDKSDKESVPEDKQPFPAEKHEKKPVHAEKRIRRPYPKDRHKHERKQLSGDKPEKNGGERQQTKNEASGSAQDNPKDLPQSKSEAKEKETKESKEASERRRRARPDMPIYRPGSFRTGNGKEGGGGGKRDRDTAGDKKGSSGNQNDKSEQKQPSTAS